MGKERSARGVCGEEDFRVLTLLHSLSLPQRHREHRSAAPLLRLLRKRRDMSSFSQEIITIS